MRIMRILRNIGCCPPRNMARQHSSFQSGKRRVSSNTVANKFRTHVWALIVKPWLPYWEAFDSGQTSLTGDDKMAAASDLTYGPQGPTPDALQALAAYLELSLDKGKCVVMMRHGKDVCSVYVGDPANEEDVLTGHGTLSVAVAD